LIKGDLAAHILLDNPMRSTAQGKLHGVGIGYPVKLKVPVMIEDVSLAAAKNKLNVESALIRWGDSHLTLQGDVKFSEEEFLFDMNLSADGIEWEAVEQTLGGGNQESDLQGGEHLRIPLLEGILRVRLEFFKYGRFIWRPLRAEISFDRDTVKVAVTEANLCGISTPGVVKATPRDLSLDFTLASRNQEPGPTLTCLLGREVGMTGDFDLKGNITARGKDKELVESLRGNFESGANDGRIYRAAVLARIFAFLNVTEALMGRLPDMGKEGLRYDVIKVRGNVQNGKLNIKEAILDGPTVELVSRGEIDLVDQKINLTVLVAPHKTVDRIFKRLPLVSDILGGTLISYPVKVRGDLAAPRVSALSPSAVGSELLAIMKRTFHLPVKIIRPSRPSGEKK